MADALAWMAGQLEKAPKRRPRMWGEDHPRAILTWDQVRAVREMRHHGLEYHTIAWVMGISKSSAYMICSYQRRARG